MHNITEKINKINYLRNKTFTRTEELANLFGGSFSAVSTQILSYEMGDKSCCNISSEPTPRKDDPEDKIHE